VNVGTIRCHGNNEKLCETLGREYGTVFYPDSVEKGTGLVSEISMINHLSVSLKMCLN